MCRDVISGRHIITIEFQSFSSFSFSDSLPNNRDFRSEQKMSTENNFTTSPQLSRRSGTLYGSTKSAKSTIYGSLAETIYESPHSSPRSTSSGTNSTQKLGDSIQVKKSSSFENGEQGVRIGTEWVNPCNQGLSKPDIWWSLDFWYYKVDN